jgi:hypothetical protein
MAEVVGCHLSLQSPRLELESVHVWCVVDKVALGQVFLWVLQLSFVSIIPPCLHVHISPGGWTIDPLVAIVQRHSLTPSIWTTRTMNCSLYYVIACKVQLIVWRFSFVLFQVFSGFLPPPPDISIGFVKSSPRHICTTFSRTASTAQINKMCDLWV